MTLTQLMEGVTVIKMFHALYGKMMVTQDIHVAGIQYDSRKIKQREMFVAIRGMAVDGHTFVSDAISRGANVVVMEDDAALPDSLFMHTGVAKIIVPNSRQALARLAANYYHHPSTKLQLVGITGTNGKTTTTHLIKAIIEAGGGQAGLIGTIQYKIGEEIIAATHTTPESLELNQLLVTMIDRGCGAAVMEVSSHSLALQRVHALEYAVAGFTNLTQDHLDFHGSMDAYLDAKKMLFDGLSNTSCAVTNANDPFGERIVSSSPARVLRYGLDPDADVYATDIVLDVSGTKFNIVHGNVNHNVSSSLIGQFNVQNILAAYTTGVALNLPAEQIIRGVANLKSVPGRFEQLTSPRGWSAVIDYAHTPDALENCLRTIRRILPSTGTGKIITIFGCGGNRDRGKRPLMGRIASEASDITIITSDNPRKEDPEAIIREIFGGVTHGKKVYTEVDRRKAIEQGLAMAAGGDVVLIAGKGHEDYQIIGDSRAHFDDREEVRRHIRDTE